MTHRVFRVEPYTESVGRHIVHDPCTGLTHIAPEGNYLTGRRTLNDAEVASWPTVSPQELAREYPASICWSPIVHCNLHCPHCLDDKSVFSGGDALRRQVADLLSRSGILGVDISGGEPLLIPELPTLCKILMSGEIAVSVTTNGWLLAERAAELAGQVDAIRVSLDGPDGDSHDRWRGRGSFGKALAGIRAAISSGITVQIQTVAMASTVTRLQELLDLAAVEGVYGVTILQMLPIGEGAILGTSEMLSDDEVEAIVRKLRPAQNLKIRLRRRQNAEGFTVVRADGSIFRNGGGALTIRRERWLRSVEDLIPAEQDGSA